MKKILLIGLGGTILCSQTKEGLKPKYTPDFILKDSELTKNIELHTTQLMSRTIVYPDDWKTIAQHIKSNLNKYDGFLITMGTDTLAYTSSILSYMLCGIAKPVVITGAMTPIDRKNTDAKKNLSDSILFARSNYCGVYVVFNSKVILGSRASKTRCDGKDAFESINKDPFAIINKGNILKVSNKEKVHINKFVFDTKINTDVITIKLDPQTSEQIFSRFTDFSGFFIEGYGDGNISDNLVDAIINLIKKRKIVVISSQCLYGRLEHKYRGGFLSIKKGAISTKDMTKEAAITKLMWCMGKTLNHKKVKDLMYRNISGEITAKN